MSTADEIKGLRTAAGQAGDLAMVAICDRALAGDETARREAIECWADGAWRDFDPRGWALAAKAGDYLARYELDAEDDPGSRCGLSDATIAEVKRALGSGLTIEADDRGLRVVAIDVDE